MLKLFKNNNPVVLILIIVLASLQVLSVFVGKQNFEIPADTTIASSFILNLIEGENSLLFASIISSVLLVYIVFRLIQILNTFVFTENRNFFHGFVFLFVAGTIFSPYEMVPVLLSMLFFTEVIMTFFRASTKNRATFDFFNIGFFISIGSLFWFSTIYFVILIFAGLIILRRIVLRELLGAMLGVVLPYFLFFSFEFIFTSRLDSLFFICESFISREIELEVNFELIIFMGLTLIYAILGGFSIARKFPSLNINIREYYKIYTWIALIAVFVFFIAGAQSKGLILYALLSISLPVSYFFANAKRKLLAELLFDTYLILIILIQTNIKIPVDII